MWTSDRDWYSLVLDVEGADDARGDLAASDASADQLPKPTHLRGTYTTDASKVHGRRV
jgi:hypothetical protein